MAGEPLPIALVQMSCGSNPDTNLENAARLVAGAAENGARIICLPELFRYPYFPQAFCSDARSLAEPVPGPTTRIFSELARHHGVVVIVPLFETAPEGRFFNTAVVVDADGSLKSPYHKVHIPHDPLFWEKSYFHPGKGYQVFQTAYATIAVLICYDQWFPEAARAVALEGAEIIFYPTAIGNIGDAVPENADWRESWEIIQRSHAIANSVHVAAVNRTGTEGDISFFGSSFVCDAFGTILSRAGREETVLHSSLNLSMNREIREAWGFFRNRRPDTYARLTRPVGMVERTGTPRSLGYRMPAEWEEHEAVWISWPHDSMTFPRLCEVEEVYARFIRELSRSEQVHLLVPNEKIHHHVLSLLEQNGVPHDTATIHTCPYADVWIRDYGPIFVVNPVTREQAMVRWGFNAWGNKYDNLVIDHEVPGFMRQWIDEPVFEPGIILEGGSVEVNGKGTLLTTRSCLLNDNRNPDRTMHEIEEYLEEYLGVVKVIWLSDGIAGDDTDGHIDDIARFVNPTTVVCAWEKHESDENHHVLRENYEILCSSTDQDGNPLTVIRLPMPSAVSDGFERYPATYLNFYIGNRVVIVPVFGDPHDSEALEILSGLFPGRDVVGIDARAMVEGYGTFHCATQQQPSP